MADTEVEGSERIADMSIPEPNSGCWLWLGPLNQDGYGVVSVRGKKVLAHRLSLAAHTGRQPEGLVLHSCDVPSCVNPDHLRCGTHADNMRDALARGRIRPHVILTAADVAFIRANAKPYSRKHPDMTVGALAKRFGVCRNTVQVALHKDRAFTAFPELALKRDLNG